MKNIMMLAVAIAGAGWASQAGAADLPFTPRAEPRPICAPLPADPTAGPDLAERVASQYAEAATNQSALPVIYARSPRFVWAAAATQSCGRAVGYFNGGEYNPEAVWQCQCDYGRMVSYPLPR